MSFCWPSPVGCSPNASYDKSLVQEQLQIPKSFTCVRSFAWESGTRSCQRCLPTMLEAAWEVKKAFPNIHVMIAKSSSVSQAAIHDMVSAYKTFKG